MITPADDGVPCSLHLLFSIERKLLASSSAFLIPPTPFKANLVGELLLTLLFGISNPEPLGRGFINPLRASWVDTGIDKSPTESFQIDKSEREGRVESTFSFIKIKMATVFSHKMSLQRGTECIQNPVG